MEAELGTMGALPFLAAGAGPPLLFLGGLAPETGPTGRLRRVNLATIEPFATAHRVHFLNRRAGLPMAALAAEHAAAIRSHFGRPVDVIGASTGGSIAQQLAAEHPDCVARLVLVSTACRLGPLARAEQRAVAARVHAGADREAMALIGAAIPPPWRGRLAAATLASALGPRLFPRPGLLDMAVTIDAEDGFDLAACPRPIEVPTLIVAGGRDRFYAPELFAETASLIPRSHLEVFARRGHVTVSTDRRYVPTVEGFLTAG